MKRAKSAAFLMVVTCILFLAMVSGTVTAVYPGYSVTVYSASEIPTLDGAWTTNTEWDDAATATPHPAEFLFRIKYEAYMTEEEFYVYDWYIVEFFTDNTNDAGDYVSICYDCGVNGTAGAAPQPDDIRIDYVGHGSVVTYKGDGTGWTSASLTMISVAQSLAVSKLGSSPHWITEFRIEKTLNGPEIDNAIHVSVYDDSNPGAGVIAWPPTSQDVPNDFGANPADVDEDPYIPEGVSLGAIVLVSSVAVLAGSFILRKRLKIGKPLATP